MLNIKRINHVLNTTVYSMLNTVPLIHLVSHRQLKFLRHNLRVTKEEPARRYALYIPTIGKRRPGWSRISYLTYVQRLLGDNEGAMQQQQIAALADDRCAWRNLVVACYTANFFSTTWLYCRVAVNVTLTSRCWKPFWTYQYGHLNNVTTPAPCYTGLTLQRHCMGNMVAV